MALHRIKSNRIARTRADVVFDVINYTVLGVIMLIVLLPLLYVVSCSFSSPVAVTSGKVWFWPVDPSLDAYKAVLEYHAIWTGYRNTLIYTVCGTLFSVSITLLAAYPLSRHDFKMRRIYATVHVYDVV